MVAQVGACRAPDFPMFFPELLPMTPQKVRHISRLRNNSL
jgi:hypothetical protein